MNENIKNLEPIFKTDILEGFEQANISFPNDYEGEVICTIIRKLNNIPTKKAVLYIHGFNDYFFQTEMADEYLKNGFNFYALDLRKYGRSHLVHQKFNNVRNLKEYYPEINYALEMIRSDGNLFTLLNGHSMGGLLVSMYAKNHYESKLFDALFLNSPFFELNENILKKYLVPKIAKLGKYFPNFKVNGGFSVWYGRSIHYSEQGEWHYELKWKPLKPDKINLGWLNAICSAQKEFKKGISISQPILILHSFASPKKKYIKNNRFEQDIILNVNRIRNHKRFINGSITIKSIKNGMHDLMLSKKKVRELVYKTLFDWCNQL